MSALLVEALYEAAADWQATRNADGSGHDAAYATLLAIVRAINAHNGIRLPA